ncbi:chloride channel protein [Pararhizobium mangrovi]|uniref:Chloride channel protein n=1 Tax=Pararhizobium mangrovi TaxID=2590452 RepID=A0A506U9A9_9HYPH|nr:chloride channel protein [Pararhizobium mangrovi]TPW29545.1 chloride channel protein [Pararhizobium mangrovi]
MPSETAADPEAQLQAEQAVEPPAERELRIGTLSALALLVGIVAGLGAIFFKFLIALITNFAFYGEFSFHYDPNAFGPPSPLGPFLIAIPVIGGLIVVFLVRSFAPEAKGHGVPEVMYAIYHQSGNVRGVVALVKSLASAISIGTGASVGREGPIIQIGSSFGSTLGRRLNLIRSQKIILLSAGAGAGIAATFNTPLGGVLFATEVLLPEISTRSFLPVVVATATSTYGYRLVMGAESAFTVPFLTGPVQVQTVNGTEIVLSALIGVVLGVAAWAFVRLLAFMEDFFERMPISPYLQSVIGMAGVGLMGYLFLLAVGHYEVLGVGYATIQDIINGNTLGIVLLTALFFGKLLATCVSLGAGSSGGIFSPSLFMGATLGAAIAGIADVIMPGMVASVPTYAMIGMAAMVGASTSAAMTAIVMIFEMTRDYNIILPLTLAVAIALGIRRALITNDIYTVKLRGRGTPIPTDRTTNMFLVQPIREVVNRNFKVLPQDMTVADAINEIDPDTTKVIVSDGQRLAGFIRFGTIRYNMQKVAEQKLGELSSAEFIIAAERNNLNDVITRMNRRGRSYAIVIRGNRGVPRPDEVVGIIDRDEIAQAVIRNHYG